MIKNQVRSIYKLSPYLCKSKFYLIVKTDETFIILKVKGHSCNIWMNLNSKNVKTIV